MEQKELKIKKLINTLEDLCFYTCNLMLIKELRPEESLWQEANRIEDIKKELKELLIEIL